MKTSSYKLPVIYGKHKTCRLPFEKKMYKFNKQQINNELRPNDFSKGVSITQKTKPKTHHVVRFEYFNRCLPSAPKGKWGLNRKNNIVCSKIVSGNLLNKLVQLNHITQRGLGANPVPLGNFYNFLAKIVNLAPFGRHFTRFQSHLKQVNY